MEPLPIRIEALVEFVLAQHPDADVLAHLADAVLAAEQLGVLADHLIGHFVDKAREAGATWTEIGVSMGVSKQAAQKRFVAPAADDIEAAGQGRFSRFTPRARSVVVRSQEHARRAGHEVVGTEHVLLAILDDPRSLATLAMSAQGVDLDAAREAVRASFGPPSDAVPAHIAFGDETKQLLQRTLAEALRLGHNYIGTEHMVLALLRDDRSVGGRVLATLGVDADGIDRFIADETITAFGGSNPTS
jgi:hypothetical protein